MFGFCSFYGFLEIVDQVVAWSRLEYITRFYRCLVIDKDGYGVVYILFIEDEICSE
jgi:hypothetical protein